MVIKRVSFHFEMQYEILHKMDIKRCLSSNFILIQVVLFIQQLVLERYLSFNFLSRMVASFSSPSSSTSPFSWRLKKKTKDVLETSFVDKEPVSRTSSSRSAMSMVSIQDPVLMIPKCSSTARFFCFTAPAMRR